MIRVFDLANKVELGTVLDGEGSINALEATQNHVLSSSANGSISIWRVKDWAKLHTLKGPKSGLLTLSMHPSQRMVLAGSKSGKLTLWNLVKGRVAFTTRLGQTVEEVQWAPCGLFYAVRLQKEILVSAVGENVKHEGEVLKHHTQLTSFAFAGCSQVLLASDIHGLVLICDTTTSKVLYLQAEDQSRITELGYVTMGEVGVMVTLGTSGSMKVWNVTSAVQMVREQGYEDKQTIENREDLLVFSHNLDCRCSALTVTTLAHTEQA